MTLPSKKYRSWETLQRIGNLKIALFFGGIIIGIILLAAVSPKYVEYNKVTGEPIDLTIDNIGPVLLFLFSTLGVLLFLWHRLGERVPDWMIRRPPKQVTVDGTYPKGSRPPQLSNKNIRYSGLSQNFKRVMYHPTRNETLFAMGIVFLFLSVITYYRPLNNSYRWLGDALIFASFTTGLSQYFICLIIAFFFCGFVIYSERRSKHSGKLLIVLSAILMFGIFSLIISFGTGPNLIFVKNEQFTVTELIEMGNTLLSSDYYKEAISYYDRALVLEPNNGEALYQKRIALHYLDR